ncbi:MAG: bifunctional diaminohydroxyphosphoribosylaminopyrimidine deaminase/5-amino-6-(5-phosphoribosylamino)uracil reductase RibD [Pirellulales bacterium]|nr:bifunctional diaminohydroxyphosphoribosylaminopyrimidine deaminase/5-amino-6-(5-phosphoribosylamino)uracil reductase RibD [Pirellulales bacterium]
MDQREIDLWHMRRALELAVQGQGHVEPNPMVGCVIVRGAEIIGEGWHRRFGGPHAEVEALRMAGARAAGATLVVNLEPCCHLGKTPPCTNAILKAGISRVVIAQRDPFPKVAGGGIARLEAAGLEVSVGLLEDEARQLAGPFLKLITLGRPWVIAKWAMTLDGKTATRTGESRWISSPESRAVVHRLRGRVDAVMVGRRTAELDDPLLTARPPGPRTPARIVVDTRASLSLESQLVQTAQDSPVIVAVGETSDPAARARLTEAGCEVLVCPGETPAERLDALLAKLGRRRMTNLLVEGGGQLAGSFLDAGQIDEVHLFLAPKLLGGAAPTPLAGEGLAHMPDALRLDRPVVEQLGPDVYIHGRVEKDVEGEEPRMNADERE